MNIQGKTRRKGKGKKNTQRKKRESQTGENRNREICKYNNNNYIGKFILIRILIQDLCTKLLVSTS